MADYDAALKLVEEVLVAAEDTIGEVHKAKTFRFIERRQIVRPLHVDRREAWVNGKRHCDMGGLGGDRLVGRAAHRALPAA